MMSSRRIVLAGIVLVCSLVGAVDLSAPVALAVSPPVVEDEAVLDVAGTSATLQAKINPQGSETTYRFEYGTGGAYGSAIPVPDGIVGSGSAGVTVSAHPQDLSPHTVYHYRVVAIVGSRSETVPGADGTFTTQTAGSEFSLPDGRQWELVSPPNKHGGSPASLRTSGPLQAAGDGSGIAYQMDVPTEAEPAGFGQDALIQVHSARGPGGWSSRDISVPRESVIEPTDVPEYVLFSTDLSLGLVKPNTADKLLAGQTGQLDYVRRESLCNSPATASECYMPIPGSGNFSFETATPDFGHILITSKMALTSTPIVVPQIYEWSADAPRSEQSQLVSVLPESEGGGSTSGLAWVGPAGNSGVRNAVSSNGSRVFWMENPAGSTELHLYMRDTVKQETVRLDVQQPGAPSGESALPAFLAASSDGSKVFFTDSQRLTAQSGTGDNKSIGDLYECQIVEAGGRLKCDLTDLTPARAGQSAEVREVLVGASKDGSHVYFVANGVLSENRNGEGETATQGACARGEAPSGATCNLYEYHGGTMTFVARLSAEDENDWATENEGRYYIALQTAVTSPDGRYLAFMSDRSLTGYDNRDANSGKPDMEVYLYDVQTGRLTCSSCNPTGSRPVGVEVRDFEIFTKKKLRENIVAADGGNGGIYGPENWIAANLPPGEAIEGTNGRSLYHPRALSDSGRLFFNSGDALVPQDVNGEEDVYEFEPEGTGTCSSSSVNVDQGSGGCVSLISAGTSSEESGFVDASEDGSDVFFLTKSRLTSQDLDTGLDLYDSHACTASMPCVAPPVSPPPCSTGDSCKAAPTPQPAIFGAPASSTFTGVGNVPAVSLSAPVVKSRPLTRAQRLARALRVCAKKPKSKRSACKRHARRRFGGKNAGRATRKARG